MKTLENKQGEIRTRYQIRDVKSGQWDSYFAQMNAYKMVLDLKSSAGRSYGKRIIFSVALTQEWLDEQNKKHEGLKCILCNDTGSNHGKFCTCSLGSIARLHFKTYYEQ